MILHSPTERGPLMKHLARAARDADTEISTSSLPERRGVDFLWRGQGQWWGMQRKELHDLLASFDDGRLTKEIAQMTGAGVALPTLLVEGRIRVDLEGVVGTSGWGKSITRSQLRARLRSVGLRGVYVEYADDARDTAQVIVDAYVWSQRASHTTSATRPAASGAWGKPTNRDYQMHLLQGLPDVGAKTAGAILDTLGRCPLVMNVTAKELMSVPGIGKVTARRIIETAPACRVESTSANARPPGESS